ncbi:MAG: GNAT family N-acetyltransferase [Bacteroidota bacterium]
MSLTLETERLWLRPPELEDAESMFEHYGRHPEVCEFLSWKAHENTGITRAWIADTITKIESGKSVRTFIVPKDLGEPVGAIGASLSPFKIHVGYALGKDFWNKGYVSEAFNAMIDHFFTHTKVVRVEAICDVENIGSARVMEKAGLIKEAFLPYYDVAPNLSEGPRDMFMYGRIKTK